MAGLDGQMQSPLCITGDVSVHVCYRFQSREGARREMGEELFNGRIDGWIDTNESFFHRFYWKNRGWGGGIPMCEVSHVG